MSYLAAILLVYILHGEGDSLDVIVNCDPVAEQDDG